MRIFITGATGFIGRALVPALRREGHDISVWARSVSRARGRLGAEIEPVDAAGGRTALIEAVGRADAVINLAGEPLMPARWTARRKAALRASRIGLTGDLVAAIEAAPSRPRVLISSSAVGYYGDRGDEPLVESSTPGKGFLSEICQDWEAAAHQATRLGVRVALIRTGVVLGRDGGALASMRPPFELGLGGPFGSGRQYLPWIHLHDLVAVIANALTDDRYVGPINGVAPGAVTVRDFVRALGRSLGRPAMLPMPAVLLRLLFGEAASTLLASQRVEPAALDTLGFRFAFPLVTGALADVTGGPAVEVRPLVSPVSDHGSAAGRRYLDRRPPVYDLRTRTVVGAPLDETFAFFSKAENLGLLTPAAMRFSVVTPVPAIADDVAIEYRLRIGPIPITWRSRIVNWAVGARFVDYQEAGPYRSWWHEHRFRAEGPVTVMEDRVSYAPPFGPVGRLANRFFIVPTLRRIFRYRADVIRLRFGTAPVPAVAARQDSVFAS
jgi:uncharacterized protein (TIGR01777 family)